MYAQSPQRQRHISRIDPACAICSAPPAAQCDCEANALNDAVAQAEEQMMEAVYSNIRYVKNTTNLTMNLKHENGACQDGNYIREHPLLIFLKKIGNGFKTRLKTISYLTSVFFQKPAKMLIQRISIISRHKHIITAMDPQRHMKLPRSMLSIEGASMKIGRQVFRDIQRFYNIISLSSTTNYPRIMIPLSGILL